jgi:hypothetical protein
MKRRPRTSTRRTRTMRRQRVRRFPPSGFPDATDASSVSAAVIFTDPFPATGTAAWLEPDSHERTCTVGPF